MLVLITGLPGTDKSSVAEDVAGLLGSAILGHDWAMSGLRPYPEVQNALEAMEPSGHGAVGWSILRALARAQLRRGASVVVEGMARTPEIEQCHQLAEEEVSRFVVILTECPDPEIHRSRIRERDRAIPDWYELSWDDVQHSRARWSPPEHVDLRVRSTDPRSANRALLSDLLSDS